MKIHNIGFTGDYGPKKVIKEALDDPPYDHTAPRYSIKNKAYWPPEPSSPTPARPPCHEFYSSIQGNRKLTSLDEVTAVFDVNDATEKERHCLYQLPIRSIDDEEANDLFECRPPGGYQFFILRHHFQFYFVDTQGFSYSRYVTRLKNFDQPDLGI